MAVEMYLFRVLSGTGSAQLGQSRRERATWQERSTPKVDLTEKLAARV